jgi:drug/metabolite transporter (DMT)-like permease
MCVIWGIPYFLIKVAVEHIDPWTLVLARTALGAALLLPLAAARGELRGLRGAWGPIVLFSVIEIMIPWLALGFAEQELSSSLTGLLLAAVPLVGALIARVDARKERLDRRQAVGLVAGFAGVAALVGLDVGVVDPLSVALVGVVAVAYAIGPIILVRRLSDRPPMGVIAVSLAVTTVTFAPVGIARAPRELPPGDAVAAVVGLAVVCTALAFVLFFQLIAEIGPVRATVITYVNPAVAVVLGVLLLDERFTTATAIGFALVLSGSVLSARRRAAAGSTVPAPRTAPVEPEVALTALGADDGDGRDGRARS